MVTESERARLDLQIVFGVHVFSRAKVVPDLAISRGEEAYRGARLLGDRGIEFLAAGGVALSLLELGDVEGAERWLGNAATAASNAPSQTRARQLETWRGMAKAAAGDIEGMRRHLERAVAIATEAGRGSGRCEALARLAVEASRLLARSAGNGSDGATKEVVDPQLAELIERCAAQVKGLLPLLPGHAPWGAQVDSALASLALARGDAEAAATAAGSAVQALLTALHEDASLEILIPTARALFGGAPPEIQQFVRNYLQLMLSRIAQGTADEAIRVRWLKGPIGRELVELAGPMDSPVQASAAAAGPSLDDGERRLLQLLTEGRTNAEIATELELGDDEVAQRLARLLARLGTSSRAEATSLAFRGLAAVGSH
jgi:DNA-binding NarL/FixJ family response regulator